jgi:DNA-binding SARP family transcriptional activator/tetratricopeptide (TPR) repeat protein
MPAWERMTEFSEGQVEFRILGPVELWVNGRRYDLGSPKERCVLGILLWRLGQPVSTESLVDLVWGGNPPDSALASLYAYVSRLRKDLRRAAGEDRAWLRRRSGYYTLDADLEAVDLYRFRELHEQARAAAEHGDDKRAAALLHDAEKLWRGTPLAGLSGMWAERVRTRLEEERLDAIRDRIKAELRLGRHAALVGEISDLVVQHPLDEVLVEHLMLVLYRCGRQAEALETYRRAHHRLVSEVGSEPGSALRTLHQRMLNGDPELDEPLARAARRDPQPNSLPRDNPHFTGRTAELDQLFGMIDAESGRGAVTVVAINGMAGVGKSTLAIHAAHLLGERYQDRFYLHLHTHDPVEEPIDPAAGLGTLLRTLGIPPKGIPGTLEERATLWRTQLANRRALIVLEDADDPDQIRPLLPGSPGCLVLITCRRRMIGLPGIFWLPLGIMRQDEAISLFTRVAGAERAHDQGAMARVVGMCGHLPLAIQLAGSRLRHHPAWSITDLASRLSRSQHRLSEIGAGDREIAGSLELSYRYLMSEQKQLFRQLALHPGTDFSVYTAAAAAGNESLAATEQALDALLDHYLLEERSPGRFAFHDLIREYAHRLSLLDDSETDRRRTVQRILDYYLYLADRADRIVYPFHRRMDVQVTYLPANMPPLNTRDDSRKPIEDERANIFRIMHYAARQGWPAHAGLLPHVLAQFMDTWGYWEDATTAHRMAVRTWREVSDHVGEARALTELCFTLGRTGGYAEALQCAHDALSIFRAQRDRSGEADILDCMGLVLWQSSRYHEALSRHDEALAIWRSINDRHGEADALSHGAMPLWHTSRYEDALKRFHQALAVYREIGDVQGEGNSLNNIADVEQHLGHYDEALDRYQQALIILRDTGNRQREAIMFNNIGNLCQRTGRYDESLKHYRNALSIYRDIGDRRCEADALNNIGAAFRHAGHHGEALIHHQKALVLAHELAEPYQEARSHCSMGDVHLRTGNHSSALNDYRSALELSRRIGDVYQEALAHYGLGSVMLHTEGVVVARKHWRKALDLFEQIGVPEAGAVRSRLRAVGATAS